MGTHPRGERPAADVVAELKATGEGYILANSCLSVIKPLLAADLLDRLYLMIFPEIAGGGQRLFDDGLPASKWTLTQRPASWAKSPWSTAESADPADLQVPQSTMRAPARRSQGHL